MAASQTLLCLFCLLQTTSRSRRSFHQLAAPTSETPLIPLTSVHLPFFLFFFLLGHSLHLQSHLMTVSCSLSAAVTERL